MSIKSSMKTWIVLSFAVLVVSACKEKEVEQPEPTRPAQVWRVQSQVSEQVETYSGEVQPSKVTLLSFRVAGKVVGRTVEVGDTVKVGQVLAQLDNEDSELAVRQTTSNLEAAKSSLQTTQANLLALQNNVTASQGAVASARGSLEAARGRLSTAQGNLNATQANVESAQAGVEAARATYQSAHAALGSAQAEVKTAQLELARSEKLNRQGYLSTTVLDQHRQRLATAQANYQSVYANAQAALAQVNAAQSKVKTTQAQIKAAEGEVEAARANVLAVEGQVQTAEAQVEGAQAQVEGAQGQIGSAQAQINTITEQTKLAKNQSRYTELTSTVTGVVSDTLVEIGQVVGAGQTIVKVANSTDLEVHIKLSEQAIKQVQVGMTAKISLWAVQNTFEGSVAEIAPVADASRLWLVKVSIKDPTPNLRLGMTAKVAFSHPLPKAVSWLPATALFQSDQKPAVWVVSSANKTELKTVEIENYLEGGVLVSGLDEGLTVVAAGVNRIHQSQEIVPTPYTGQARPAGQ